uniref:Protein FMC1 homolog n=1 Tax=Oncorhynchus tshawytscha TaxID=74940 RepID=A0AAZ3PVC3_ONCTS
HFEIVQYCRLCSSAIPFFRFYLKTAKCEYKWVFTFTRYCLAQEEALYASHSYLCLLISTRQHMALYDIYHGKGQHDTEEMAGIVGLRLPTQPGGKGWEK